MRGEETTKLDREILADIAGKTNQLGLRFSPDLSKLRTDIGFNQLFDNLITFDVDCMRSISDT